MRQLILLLTFLLASSSLLPASEGGYDVMSR